MDWYVSRSGEREGPFSIEQLREMAEVGNLHANHLVWHPGMDEWKAAELIPGLLIPPSINGESDFCVPSPTIPPKAQHSSNLNDVLGPTSNLASHGSHRADMAISKAEKPNWVPKFISKHWRGDYSLGTSYWVVGVLLTIASTVVVTVLVEAKLFIDASPKMAAAGVFLLYVVIILISIWQLVGIWRSADNHPKRGGQASWAGVAKFMVVLGLLSFSTQMMSVGFPVMRESVKILTGETNVPPYEIRLLRNGTELELSGGMPQGTAAGVRVFLDSSPAIKIVHMNSEGGLIAEAYKLHKLINERGLVTFTSRVCASACAIAFLAGRERYLGEGGKLGFHSTSYGSLSVKGELAREMNKEVRETLSKSGVPQEFINRALNTDSKDMWYPNNDELVAANVIHAVVDPGLFGLSGVKEWRDAHLIEKSILQVPFFAALSKHDNTNYAKLKRVLIDGVQQGKSQNEITSAIRSIFLNEVLPGYLKVAPDSELARYWQSQFAEMRYLAKLNPRYCADFAFPQFAQAQLDLQRILPKELLTEDMDSLVGMINAIATRGPQASISTQGQRDLELVFARILKSNPWAVEVIASPETYKNEPKYLCAATLILFEEIFKLPGYERSGPAIRYMASQ